MRVLLVALAVGTLLKYDSASLDQELKERPVSKVINLLREMGQQLSKEGEEDQSLYDRIGCWCETNDKEKTAAITAATNRIASLESTISELTAKSARLNEEITQLNSDIEANRGALDKAAAIRAEELASFNQEEKDMLASIQALGNAVTVLSKHHEMPAEALVSIASILKHHLHKKGHMLTMTTGQHDTVTAFLQQPAGFQSYAPASGQIFGILKQMKETFESNLSAAQKEELQASETYVALKAAKEAEIAAASEQVDNKTVELADTDEANVTAKQDLEDTKNALDADTAFLLDLQKKCKETDEEFASRTKARNDEIAAVNDAIQILSNDDAFDNFGKTMGFVQVQIERSARTQAAAMLKAAAQKTGDSQLAALASSAELDAFTKVKAAIDDMVTALTKEKEDEIKHRDWCIKSFAENDKQTAVNSDEKSDLESKVESLTSQLEQLTSDIKDLNAQVAETQVQMKRASEDRESANAEFQATIHDQRVTQAILNKALDRLSQVYASKAFLQFKVQQRAPAGPPPPQGFKDYSQNKGAGGVLGLLRSVIADAKLMETEAIRAEQDSQTAYEGFVKNSNTEIAAAQKDLINKAETKAKAEAEKVQATTDLASTMTDLENLASYNAELHGSCDFVTKNFEVRQSARDQEVEALRQAKAVLSGADFS